MALVSGGKSTLNPNAPLYIPAAVRQVEDFSPEWYDLITTSTWFRDYWLSEHQEADIFYNPEEDILDNGDNIVDLLPDDIDLGLEEDFLYMESMESQFQEFAQSAGNQANGPGKDLGLSGTLFPAGSKFAQVPAKAK